MRFLWTVARSDLGTWTDRGAGSRDTTANPHPISPSPTRVQVSWPVKGRETAPQAQPQGRALEWGLPGPRVGALPRRMWRLAGKGQGGSRVPQQVVSSLPSCQEGRKVRLERHRRTRHSPQTRRPQQRLLLRASLRGDRDTSEGRGPPPPCADGARPHPPRRPLEQHPPPDTHPQPTGPHTAPGT